MWLQIMKIFFFTVFLYRRHWQSIVKWNSLGIIMLSSYSFHPEKLSNIPSEAPAIQIVLITGLWPQASTQPLIFVELAVGYMKPFYSIMNPLSLIPVNNVKVWPNLIWANKQMQRFWLFKSKSNYFVSSKVHFPVSKCEVCREQKETYSQCSFSYNFWEEKLNRTAARLSLKILKIKKNQSVSQC